MQIQASQERKQQCRGSYRRVQVDSESRKAPGIRFAWFRLEGYPGQDRTTNRCSAIAGERRSHFAASVGDAALATLTLIILLTDIVLGASTGSAAHTDVCTIVLITSQTPRGTMSRDLGSEG